MKKFYISALLLLTTIGVFGQSGISFNDTVRAYGNGGDGFDNVISDSNLYYILGYIYDGSYSNPHLTQVNFSGDIINKRKYIDTNFNYAIYPYNSMVLKDSILLFCGQKWGDSTGTLGFVFAINKFNLDTIWTKTYTHPDTLIAQTAQDVFSVLTAIKPTLGGGYILTGNYNKDCITGNLRSFLMKIDSVGNVEWRKTYDNYYTFFDVEVAHDSGYYVPSGYNGTNALQIVKFNKNGIYQWKADVTTNTMAGYPVEMSVVGSNYAIVGYKYLYDVANHYTAVSVSKVDLISRTIVWEKVYYIYKKFQCVSMHQAMGVETLPNGDIIVSGTAKNYGYDAVILKLNSNGDSLWCKSYDFDPDPYDCQLNDLIITDDGGFMGVGFFSDQNGPGWTAWMFKTDDNGTIGWEEITRTENKYFAKIYPNPSHDYTTLMYDCSYSNLTYIIMDATGKEVKTDVLKTIEDLSFNEILIDLSELSSGTYYFVVKTNKESLFSEKLIITE